MPGPLAGIRVLEFSQIIAGPFAGMLLADLGADVIKFEPPGGETMRLVAPWFDGESRSYLTHNRGKRSVAADLSTPEGQAIVHRLAKVSDVVLINYRPGVAEQLNIGYEQLAPLNPRLIYCEETAFGRKGPLAQRGGVDFIAQAMSGLLAGQGHLVDGIPIPMIPPPADYATALSAVGAICAALFARERGGSGQRIDCSLLSTALSVQTGRFNRVDAYDAEQLPAMLGQLAEARAAGASFADQIRAHDRGRPPNVRSIYYRSYQTADGFIAVGAFGPAVWARFRQATGLNDPRVGPDGAIDYAMAAGDPRNLRVIAEAEALFRSKGTEEWATIMEIHGVPAGPILFAEELLDHPQVEANGLALDLEHPQHGPLRMAGPPFQFSETKAGARTASPALGADADDVLALAGYTVEEVAQLRAGGVLA